MVYNIIHYTIRYYTIRSKGIEYVHIELMDEPTPQFGRGDDKVGNPHRAQISQLELCELEFLNSSCSSLSSC